MPDDILLSYTKGVTNPVRDTVVPPNEADDFVDQIVTNNIVEDTNLTLTIETTTPDELFTLPLTPGTSEGLVDMDDGNGFQPFSVYNDPVFQVTYPTQGIKTISLSGNINSISFFGVVQSDKAAVRQIEQMGDVFWNDANQIFASTGLTSVTFGTSNTRNVRNWFAAFSGCANLTTVDFRNIQTNLAENFQNMFADNPNLTTVIGIENITTANLQRADEMFNACPNLDASQLDISGWNFESLLPVVPGGNQRGLFNFIDDNAAFTQANYDALLTNMLAQNIAPGCFFGFGNSPYTTGGAVEAARRTLIEDRGLYIEDAGNAPPDQMEPPVLSLEGTTSVTAVRAAPPFSNGLPITRYELQYRLDGGGWVLDTDFQATETYSGLPNGALFEAQSRAVNFNGVGTWSTIAQINLGGGGTVEARNIGNLPVFNSPVTGDVAITVDGTTYTTRANDGAPLTDAMIKAAPTFFKLPVVTGAPVTGGQFVIEPGKQIYTGEGFLKNSSKFQQRLDGVDIPGGTGLVYDIQEADAGKVFTVAETFEGVTVISAPVGPIASSNIVLSIANPSFETGDITGWEAVTGTVQVLETPVDFPPSAGDFYCRGGVNTVSEIRQDIDLSGLDLTGGVRYEFVTRFFQNDASGDRVELLCQLLNGAGAVIASDSEFRNSPTAPEGELGVVIVPADPAAVTLRIRCVFNIGSAGTLINAGLDEISGVLIK